MKLRLSILFFLLLAYGAAQGQLPVFGNAAWIAAGYKEPKGKRPCAVFTRTFAAKKNITSASLYITALGLYEASLNGKRIGNDYFSPGWTSYSARLQYQRYELKGIRGGNNHLAISVGDGWYRGTFRNLKSDTSKNNYGSEAAVLVRLVLTYANGEKKEVVSSRDWQSLESQIRYSELYDGEKIDMNFRANRSYPVKLIDPPTIELVASSSPPVRKQETFGPKKILLQNSGEKLIDFGQNIAGWVELTVTGKKGDTLTVRHGELLDSVGKLYAGNLRNAKATDIYILSGDEKIVLRPHFTYHGFRYAQISAPKNLRFHKISSVALYSDLKRTGKFECSDPMLNKLQQNIEWGMKGNFIEVPTDCPQRSERLAWTGDAQVFTPTASFLYDTRAFYGKWLRDVSLEQGGNGGVPTFVPTSSPMREEVYGVAGWGDAAVIIPWELYQAYGDTATLKAQYPSMKKWVDYITSVSAGHLWKNRGYGDWYAMGDSTSLHFIDQCFYFRSTDLLARAAKVLGHTTDAQRYPELLANIKKAFSEAYGKFDTKSTGTQTAYALALRFGLLEESQKGQIASLLAEKVRQNGGKLATGFLGTPHLLFALSENGQAEAAYRLLMQRECPSWLYPFTKGATTIWERWDAIRPDGEIQETSFNHYSYGAVGEWMYGNILGIKALLPGYREIEVSPIIGGGLSWAKGSYLSRYGKISVSWKLLQNREFVLNVEIPKNVKATIRMPAGGTFAVTGGKHQYKGKL